MADKIQISRELDSLIDTLGLDPSLSCTADVRLKTRLVFREIVDWEKLDCNKRIELLEELLISVWRLTANLCPPAYREGISETFDAYFRLVDAPDTPEEP